MSEKQIVVVVGYPGSGKSAICAELEKQYGFTVFRPSDVIRNYARTHEIVLKGRQDYVNCHVAMNKENPIAIIEPVLASDESRICLDGLRSPYLLDQLRAHEPDVTLIALDCPIETRFARVHGDESRQGTHRTRKTLDEFQADEAPDYVNPDPNLPNMQAMMASADHHIDASQPLKLVMTDLEHVILASHP